MAFLKWFFDNFTPFFGIIFLINIFLMIDRFLMVYKYLGHISSQSLGHVNDERIYKIISFLDPYFQRLEESILRDDGMEEFIVSAIWHKTNSRIKVHLEALLGYGYALIQWGFGGTIFGTIVAFCVMFKRLDDQSVLPSKVLLHTWSHGLSTALYTSLAAAIIGAIILTVTYSFLYPRFYSLGEIVDEKIFKIMEKRTNSKEEAGDK